MKIVTIPEENKMYEQFLEEKKEKQEKNEQRELSRVARLQEIEELHKEFAQEI
eukprot:CAMPEP_0170559722 /NCGR_PEP_ID=MMETSP0211-20121228/44649_1 /TAXON_ID=311385 /ORGANISM="Pseudokeronopsis sp., Strain OXSARD2" /LENGTH=52 /DNA_ID=CAMNT_0010873111 /DNA_START=58 /DNA_END=216 /DNA_ORIENTATION=+